MNRFEIAKKLKKKNQDYRATLILGLLQLESLKSRTEGSPDFKHRGVK